MSKPIGTFFTFFILNAPNSTVSMIQKTKKKRLHAMEVSTFILFVLMCLRSVVRNKTQGQLYIPGILFVGFVLRWKFYIKTYVQYAQLVTN